jgi:hypothetical protein
MSKEPKPGVIGSLPRSRPHRRSDKRPAPTPRATEPTPPAPTPRATEPTPPEAPERSPGALETAVQAAAELAEIGLHAGARALRRAVSRLPRP